MKLQFNDASQNINAPSATVLDINATDEIEFKCNCRRFKWYIRCKWNINSNRSSNFLLEVFTVLVLQLQGKLVQMLIL